MSVSGQRSSLVAISSTSTVCKAGSNANKIVQSVGDLFLQLSKHQQDKHNLGMVKLEQLQQIMEIRLHLASRGMKAV
jgi:hypothetical protein